MIFVQPYQPQTAEEYAAIVDVYNQAQPNMKSTVDEWQHRDKRWPKSHFFHRFIARLEGQYIVEGALMEPHWAHVPGHYSYGYSVLPEYDTAFFDGQTIHDFVYTFVSKYVADRNLKALTCFTREDKPDQVQWLVANGFRQTMREPASQLNVSNFDGARFDDVCERVADGDIQILSLAELQNRDPNWLQNIYNLCMEVEADVPSTNPFTPLPMEEFEKGLDGPNFLPDGWFIAVDDTDPDSIGPYAGITSLGASQADAEKLYTWLTGVRRQYRRRGIALAMKVHAIRYAQKRRIKFIDTDNEETNPMYQINLKLGFESLPAWLEFEKKMVSG